MKTIPIDGDMRLEYCGQFDRLGRYCTHTHLIGKDGYNSTSHHNAIEEGWGTGTTIHGTHGSTVSNNVYYNCRGAGIYVEDGNEVNNSISYNVIISRTVVECQSFKETALYLIGMHNYLLGNHMVAYQNTFFSPGGCCGEGKAWGKVCPNNTPIKFFKGQVTHDCGRFGLYFDNQYARNVELDEDGYYTDSATCNAYLPTGEGMLLAFDMIS